MFPSLPFITTKAVLRLRSSRIIAYRPSDSGGSLIEMDGEPEPRRVDDTPAELDSLVNDAEWRSDDIAAHLIDDYRRREADILTLRGSLHLQSNTIQARERFITYLQGYKQELERLDPAAAQELKKARREALYSSQGVSPPRTP